MTNTILYFPSSPFKHLGDQPFLLLSTEDGKMLRLDDQPNPIYYALCDNTSTIDVFHRWGCFVKDGDYKSLLDRPVYSGVQSNDWHEYDGTEPLCDSLRLQSTREIVLPLYFTDSVRLQEFFQFFGNNSLDGFASTVHQCIFEDLCDRVYTLRLKSYGNLKTFVDISSVDVTFVEDDIRPVVAPSSSRSVVSSASDSRGYELCYNSSGYNDALLWESYPLESFGVRVLDGSGESVLQPPSVKENVLVHGVYDDRVLVYNGKDLSLKLLLRCDSMSEFLSRWDTFFWYLTEKSSEHIFALQTPYNIGNYNCVYYKSLKVDRFQPYGGGKIWCECTLTVTCLDDKPTNDNDVLLSTEDGKLLSQVLPLSGVEQRGVYKYLNKLFYYSLSSPFPDIVDDDFFLSR